MGRDDRTSPQLVSNRTNPFRKPAELERRGGRHTGWENYCALLLILPCVCTSGCCWSRSWLAGPWPQPGGLALWPEDVCVPSTPLSPLLWDTCTVLSNIQGFCPYFQGSLLLKRKKGPRVRCYIAGNSTLGIYHCEDGASGVPGERRHLPEPAAREAQSRGPCPCLGHQLMAGCTCAVSVLVERK